MRQLRFESLLRHRATNSERTFESFDELNTNPARSIRLGTGKYSAPAPAPKKRDLGEDLDRRAVRLGPLALGNRLRRRTALATIPPE